MIKYKFNNNLSKYWHLQRRRGDIVHEVSVQKWHAEGTPTAVLLTMFVSDGCYMQMETQKELLFFDNKLTQTTIMREKSGEAFERVVILH